VAIVAVASQLIPVSRRNPPIDKAKTLYSVEKVPPLVKAVFARSCKNCHSNETSWPWYSYIAPGSWIVANDVHDGRKKMNFSEWGTYSPQRKEQKLDEICEQITNGEMPDQKYTLVHRSSRVTPEERDAVCQWTENARQF
jgi:hypothetical protein